MVKPRLARADWIKAGLAALASEGPGGIAADPMARRLGVSRGSFYWHFEDVAAFHAALLEAWEAIAVDQPHDAARAGAESDPRTYLRRLIGTAMRAPTALEAAIRRWAMLSPQAAAAVARIDGRRRALLAEAYRACGLDPARAEARATALGWAYLGRLLTPEQVADEAAVAALTEIHLAGL